MQPTVPRAIDPGRAFHSIVGWLADRIEIDRAPGFVVGLSGTDSILCFLAAARAFEKVGRPERVLGVHFQPSDEFLEEHPEAAEHRWFSRTALPWLRERAPNARITVDASFDWRMDGMRWGNLLDRTMIAVDGHERRRLLEPEEQYWLVGTRNRTEDFLRQYSLASTATSLLPIVHLWKSEVLRICRFLQLPSEIIERSCEPDCLCGREGLAVRYPEDLDHILMALNGELEPLYLESIPRPIRDLLRRYADDRLDRTRFRCRIPYRLNARPPGLSDDPSIEAFESADLDLRRFNHREHLRIAWVYLKHLPFDRALDRYLAALRPLLEKNSQAHRYDQAMTRRYLEALRRAMEDSNETNFDRLLEQHPELLGRL